MQWTEEEMNIAQWMLEQYNKELSLFQPLAAHKVRLRFGEQHVYRNPQNNWALNKGILEAFKSLTLTDVVWSRHTLTWRARQPCDLQNRRVVR